MLHTCKSITLEIRDSEKGSQYDINVVNEVIYGDTYKLASLSGMEFKTIIDVGAHIGTFSVLASKMWPDATIISVEPNPESFRLLCLNMKHHPSWIGKNAAVRYDKNKCILTDGVGASGGGFMISKEQLPQLNQDPSRGPVYTTIGEVDLVTIEELMEEVGWSCIDLAKFDCEGSERDVFEHSSTTFRNLLGEYHMTQADINRYLKHKWPNHDITVSGNPNIGTFWCMEH